MKAPQMSSAQPPLDELLLSVDPSAYLTGSAVVRGNCLHYYCHYVYCRESLRYFRFDSFGRLRCGGYAVMQPSPLGLVPEA